MNAYRIHQGTQVEYRLSALRPDEFMDYLACLTYARGLSEADVPRVDILKGRRWSRLTCGFRPRLVVF
jgi:hypothetical protein